MELLGLILVGFMIYLFSGNIKNSLEVEGIVIVFLVVICTIGYGINFYKLTQADFKEPYKTEVIRGIGTVVPPVGMVIGYMPVEKLSKEPKSPYNTRENVKN